MEQMRRCPFCGGVGRLTASYSMTRGLYFVWVQCDFCGGRAKTYASPKGPEKHDWKTDGCIKAVSAWNMRMGNPCQAQDEQEEIYY